MSYPKIRKRQCKACPWKKSTDPERDIPAGYCRDKHAALAETIADPGNVAELSRQRPVMACHEASLGAEYPCVGWLHNQLGVGNNLALRMAARDGRYSSIQVEGAQHSTFADTIPCASK